MSWRKPTTFGMSLGATVVGLTWVSSQLTFDQRGRPALADDLDERIRPRGRATMIARGMSTADEDQSAARAATR